MPLLQNSEQSDFSSNCETFNPMNDPQPFKHTELNALVRNIGLPKEAEKFLDSSLHFTGKTIIL